LPPWSALALPSGLALVALWRWGWRALVGATVGTALALIALGQPAGTTLWALVAMVVAALAAGTLLGRNNFDARLERARDVTLLVASVSLGALPAALLLAVGLAFDPGTPYGTALGSGLAVLAPGMLSCALAALALDRRVLQPLRSGSGWGEIALALLALAAMLALLSAPPRVSSPTGTLALFAPHVVLTALALRGHLALAASGLVAVAMVGGGTHPALAALAAAVGPASAAHAVWYGSALPAAPRPCAGRGRSTARDWAWPTGTCTATMDSRRWPGARWRAIARGNGRHRTGCSACTWRIDRPSSRPSPH
jgi:hypothetical protein